MPDNKLKIRIHIQQPRTSDAAEAADTAETTEQSIPDSDLLDSGKPPFDWRKIAFALFLLVALSGAIGYLFVGQGDDAMHADGVDRVSTGHDTSADDFTARFNYFDDSPARSAASSQDDSAAIVDNKPENIQPGAAEHIVSEQSVAAHAVKVQPDNPPGIRPGTKPDLAKKFIPPTPELKPGLKPEVAAADKPAASTSVPSNADDHPQVIRAQLTHAIKRREPVDNINQIQLERGKRKSIYVFAELHDLEDQQITVNWYFNNQPVTETKLRIGGKNWRTYASKLLNHKNAGSWRVTLTDQDDNQLAERHFIVSSRR